MSETLEIGVVRNNLQVISITLQNGKSKFYILRQEFSYTVCISYLFKDVTEGFVGCLNNLRLREKMIGRWKQNKDVIPCSEMVEPGYFFGPGGGSIMVSNIYIG